jgi:parallel beta-helix repeat protein
LQHRLLPVAAVLAGTALLPCAAPVYAQAPQPPLNVRIIPGDEPAGTPGVTISPAMISLAAGGTQRFTATVSGTSNTNVTWTATGGTIASDGTYRAGATAGTFAVTATITGGTIAKTAQVSITSSISGIAISPGQSIQAAVNANAAGATFVLKAGVHKQQTVVPKDGMTFVGEPGAIMDGENVTPRAFVAEGRRNVTIRGLVITRYVPAAQNAAIHGNAATGWIVEDSEISYNANFGLWMNGPGWIVRRNKVHHNGVLGIGGYNATQLLVENNEVYDNPPTDVAESAILAEAANIKLFTANATIRNNNVHGGYKMGIWIDTASGGSIVVENNRVVDQGSIGIWHENSWDAIIRGNTVERCGLRKSISSGWISGGAIAVSNSASVTISDNTLRDNLNGIWAMQAAGYYADRNVKNLVVQNNRIIRSGQSGIVQNVGDQSVYTSWNNKFTGNYYEIPSGLTTPFRWLDRAVTETQWKGYGQDVNGTFIR